MASKHMKILLILLAIKKATMRNPITPVKMSVIKKAKILKCCRGCEEKGATLLEGI
jgi:hypothetical protein